MSTTIYAHSDLAIMRRFLIMRLIVPPVWPPPRAARRCAPACSHAPAPLAIVHPAPLASPAMQRYRDARRLRHCSPRKPFPLARTLTRPRELPPRAHMHISDRAYCFSYAGDATEEAKRSAEGQQQRLEEERQPEGRAGATPTPPFLFARASFPPPSRAP
jgi:hypothetical protein